MGSSLALPPLPVAWRYLAILWLKGKREVVAPTSAPMLQMVAIPWGCQGRKAEKKGEAEVGEGERGRERGERREVEGRGREGGEGKRSERGGREGEGEKWKGEREREGERRREGERALFIMCTIIT